MRATFRTQYNQLISEYGKANVFVRVVKGRICFTITANPN